MKKALLLFAIVAAFICTATAQETTPLGSGWQVNYDVTDIAFRMQNRNPDVYGLVNDRSPMLLTRLGGGYRLNENFYVGALFGIKSDDRDIKPVATFDMEFNLPLEKTKVVPYANVRWSGIFNDSELKETTRTENKVEKKILDTDGTAIAGLVEIAAGVKYPISPMVDFKIGMGYSHDLTHYRGGFTMQAGIAVHAGR